VTRPAFGRELLIAASLAALYAAVLWVLPLAGQSAQELLGGSLGLALLAACGCAPLLLVDPRRPRLPRIAGIFLLGAGGGLVSLGTLGAVAGVRQESHTPAGLLCGVGLYLLALCVSWALLAPGVWLARGSREIGAGALAVMLVAVSPATALQAHRLQPEHPLALSSLFTAWFHPHEPRNEQYLQWNVSGDRERLFEAGTPNFREDCMLDPSLCPRKPGPLGTPEHTQMTCSVRQDLCTWVRLDRVSQLSGEALLYEWTVGTDTRGRFDHVRRRPLSHPSEALQLEPMPDLESVSLGAAGCAATWVLLALGLWIGLRTSHLAR
jgi:hypothetical protein